ncbi:MAG: hypothetical protein K0A99_12770 [Desulfoarculaceae bacterium]|nr:hypothetical protein [Desulfoarculaceae bacterium]
MNKKHIFIPLALLMLIGTLGACSSKTESTEVQTTTTTSERPVIQEQQTTTTTTESK